MKFTFNQKMMNRIFFSLLICLSSSIPLIGQHQAEVLIDFAPDKKWKLGTAYGYELNAKWALSLNGRIELNSALFPSDQPFNNRNSDFVIAYEFSPDWDLNLQLHRNVFSTPKWSGQVGIGPEFRSGDALRFDERSAISFNPVDRARAFGLIVSVDILQKAFGPFQLNYGVRLSQGLVTRKFDKLDLKGEGLNTPNGREVAFQLGISWHKGQ